MRGRPFFKKASSTSKGLPRIKTPPPHQNASPTSKMGQLQMHFAFATAPLLFHIAPRFCGQPVFLGGSRKMRRSSGRRKRGERMMTIFILMAENCLPFFCMSEATGQEAPLTVYDGQTRELPQNRREGYDFGATDAGSRRANVCCRVPVREAKRRAMTKGGRSGLTACIRFAVRHRPRG